MKIIDSRRQILELASILNENVVVGIVEPKGNITIDGGTIKRKYQSLKATFKIPHEVIIPCSQQNIVVFQNSFIMPTVAIPEHFTSLKCRELRDKQRASFDKWLDERPRIKNALNELIEAIKEEKEKAALKSD